MSYYCQLTAKQCNLMYFGLLFHININEPQGPKATVMLGDNTVLAGHLSRKDASGFSGTQQPSQRVTAISKRKRTTTCLTLRPLPLPDNGHHHACLPSGELLLCHCCG